MGLWRPYFRVCLHTKNFVDTSLEMLLSIIFLWWIVEYHSGNPQTKIWALTVTVKLSKSSKFHFLSHSIPHNGSQNGTQHFKIEKYDVWAFQNHVDCPHTTYWSKTTELWILVIFEISKIGCCTFQPKVWVVGTTLGTIENFFKKYHQETLSKKILRFVRIISFPTAILVFPPIFHISTCELISICGYIIEYSMGPGISHRKVWNISFLTHFRTHS